MEAATGAQHEIRSGDQVAVVVEAGGGLREYAAAGRPVLEGYPAGASPDGGRGQVLVPWPNRVAGGRYRWGDAELALAVSERRSGNAIHGLLRWSTWTATQRADDRVTLAATVWPQPGYPFRVACEIEYALGPGGLTVTMRARNEGSGPAPYGVGQHPYVTVGTERVDEAVLTVPADRWLRTGDDGIPVATEPVDGTAYDFRTPRAIGGQRLDTAFTGLVRDVAGRAVVRLARPDGSAGVDVWLGPGAEYLQVFTGDTLAVDRRRRGLGVEAMSCPADAFNSGAGLVVLEPGQEHELSWGLRPWGPEP